MTRGELYRLYWLLNFFKLFAFLARTKISLSKWECQWHSFISEMWKNFPDWTAQHVVYGGVVPFSHYEYIGTSKNGLNIRCQTHNRLSRIKRGKMRLNRILRRLGVHKIIWYPLMFWIGAPTRRQRMFEEGWLIYERQPPMNDAGRDFNDPTMSRLGQAVVFSRRKRKRQLMKFRKPEKRGTSVFSIFKVPEQKRMRDHLSLLPIILRFARRSWKIL